MRNPLLYLGLVSMLALAGVGCSCSDDDKGGSGGDAGNNDGSDNDGSDDGAIADGGDTSPFPVNDAGQVLCGDAPCECSDGVDNDEDDDIDGLDTECTGPADDDESSFATGIPGDNKDPKWQDCFFDGNSGAGDDRCRYSTKCLTGELPLTDKNCKVAQTCIDRCAPRAPNGCDCFGCCDVTFDNDTTKSILISEPCESDDPAGCTECEKSTQCGNECGECELCAGKTIADLPESCDEGYTCDDGETKCTTGTDCPDGFSCNLGCCLEVILL